MTKPLFFVGLHMPPHARMFDRCMVSINRLKNRVSDFVVNDWIMDSGAFTEISTHGHYRSSVSDYAKQIDRWSRCGNLLAAVSQDYMCEPFILDITGLTIADHQRLTIERYGSLIKAVTSSTYVMPVLQGFQPAEYSTHLRGYGDRIRFGAWVGVGSICKRNSNASSIAAVLMAIKRQRPDLKLHGFGIKKTALACSVVNDLLYSADSMAWSFAARKQGRNASDPIEAVNFCNSIDYQSTQDQLPGFWQ